MAKSRAWVIPKLTVLSRDDCPSVVLSYCKTGMVHITTGSGPQRIDHFRCNRDYPWKCTDSCNALVTS